MGRKDTILSPGDVLEIQRLRKERHALLYEHHRETNARKKNRIREKMHRVRRRLIALTGLHKW